MRLHPGLKILLYLALCPFGIELTSIVLNLAGINDPFLAVVLGVTAITWFAVRFLDRDRLVGLGLAWEAGTPADLAVGLALPMILLAGVFMVEWAAGWALVADIRRITPLFLAAALWRFAAIAWYEELFARGYVLRTLGRFMPVHAANLGASLVFTALHWGNPGISVLALGGVFLAGLLLGYCRQVTGSLYLPMAFHLSWNLCQAFLGFPVSGTQQPRILHLIREGPPLYTGGSFGPEAGLLGYLAVLIAAGTVSLYAQHRRAARRGAMAGK